MLAPDDLAALDEPHEQVAVVGVADRLLADAEDLGLDDTERVAPTQRVLAAADAIGVDGGGREGRDSVLVEVGGDDDLGLGRAQRVELLADLARLDHEVTRVETHATEGGAGDLDGRPHPFGHVVRVHEQGGADSQGRHLRLEGLALALVQQGEGVRRGPARRRAVPPATPHRLNPHRKTPHRSPPTAQAGAGYR